MIILSNIGDKLLAQLASAPGGTVSAYVLFTEVQYDGTEVKNSLTVVLDENEKSIAPGADASNIRQVWIDNIYINNQSGSPQALTIWVGKTGQNTKFTVFESSDFKDGYTLTYTNEGEFKFTSADGELFF